MTSKPIALWLVLAVALAASAVVSASASAETLHFYAVVTPATLKGTSAEDVLTTTAGTVKCKEATYSGTLSEQGAGAVELTPTYSGCTAFGFAGAEVSFNGCKYRLKGGEVEGSNREGTLDIVCPEGKEITVVAKSAGITKCTVHVPAQSGLKTVTYTNVASTPVEVTAKLSLEKIKYTHSAGTGAGACTSGSSETGSYAGTISIKGKTEAEANTAVAVLVPKPLFVLNPKKVDYKKGGAGTKKPLVIENKSQEEPILNFFTVAPAFVPDLKCGSVMLKKEGVAGANCTEEVKCAIANMNETIFIAATASYAIDTAVLEDC